MSVHDLRRAIEPLKARALVREQSRRRGPIAPDAALLARLDSAVGAARAIEGTLAELAEELPDLLPFRRLGQGGWVVGLAGNELVPRAGRRPRQAFTRIEILVRPVEGGGALEFVCHRSVRDHDLDLLRHRQPVEGTQLGFEEWLEAACLEFAEALLAARSDEAWAPRRDGRAPRP